eukprot:GHVQ01003078.1.p1 GENE.GHVQ01003078.1~~GHVQ01003078.1.p1  ORF type:complete len:572 (-),score=98.45 GHVQ01003078.1:73-1788(-)
MARINQPLRHRLNGCWHEPCVRRSSVFALQQSKEEMGCSRSVGRHHLWLGRNGCIASMSWLLLQRALLLCLSLTALGHSGSPGSLPSFSTLSAHALGLATPVELLDAAKHLKSEQCQTNNATPTNMTSSESPLSPGLSERRSSASVVESSSTTDSSTPYVYDPTLILSRTIPYGPYPAPVLPLVEHFNINGVCWHGLLDKNIGNISTTHHDDSAMHNRHLPSIHLYGLCCGARSGHISQMLNTCWNPSSSEDARIKRGRCCTLGPICNAFEVYSLSPPAAAADGGDNSDGNMFSGTVVENPAVRARHWMAMGGIPPLQVREELACVLESEGKKRGVELGVFEGTFAKSMLYNWPGAELYVLVDLWAPQEHYGSDMSGLAYDKQQKKHRESFSGPPLHASTNTSQTNHGFCDTDGTEKTNQSHHNSIIIPDKTITETMSTALHNILPWNHKTKICHDSTNNCHKLFPADYFDFVYVDARHDRTSVTQDLHNWWPKLRPGGIMAGHDYVTQFELYSFVWPSHVDPFWAVSPNGTVERDGGLVKGAVDEFALEVARPVFVTSRHGSFDTWIIRK